MSRLYMSLDPVAMQDSRLDMLDKILYSYVTSWEEKGQVCFAKDGVLSTCLGVSHSQVSFSLVKMEAMGLLEIVRGPGGRVLKSIPQEVTKNPEQDRDIFEGIY